jgi:hypothetical protein
MYIILAAGKEPEGTIVEAERTAVELRATVSSSQNKHIDIVSVVLR